MKRQTMIGNSVPRVGSVEKITGRAVYAVDVTLPNMLWGKVLRSPIAYGGIKRVDISKAVTIPGVRAVITGQGVTGIRIGPEICDRPILADREVRLIGGQGEPVAAGVEGIDASALDQ